MAIRKCPVCLTRLSAVDVVAHSYDLVCPTDGRTLEVSRISRNLSIFAGLAAGYGVWFYSSQSAGGHQALGWVFPILFAVIAFGIVAPVILMLTADLSLKAEVAVAAAETSGHGDSGHGHH